MINIKYMAGYKYQLHEIYIENVSIFPTQNIEHDFIRLTTGGVLTVKQGYAWDGCSGPTWDDKTNMRGGLVHDALYQLMREGLLPEECRELADKELRRICQEDGMNWGRAWCYFQAVRKFGDSSAKKQGEQILVAP